MSAIFIKLSAIVLMTHGLRLAGKTVGPRWSGLILGLPASTAVVLFFYAQDRGLEFAVRSAESALLGLVSAVTFALCLAKSMSRGWSFCRSFGLALGGFCMSLIPLSGMIATPWEMRVPLVLGFLALASSGSTAKPARSRNATSEPIDRKALPWLSVLALRTFIPAGCLMAVFSAASQLEATWAGLIGTFPSTFVAVAILTFLESGAGATAKTAQAFPLGNFSMVAFIATLRFAAPQWGLEIGMACGYLASFLTLAALETARRKWHDLRGQATAPANVSANVPANVSTVPATSVPSIPASRSPVRSKRKFAPLTQPISSHESA